MKKRNVDGGVLAGLDVEKASAFRIEAGRDFGGTRFKGNTMFASAVKRGDGLTIFGLLVMVGPRQTL
ncbi:MAG: hypothetical protein MZV49_22265 [Rhodopseudomonas palustris]|nr:hypothetical protein [Rhodopseudomonas palustris]